MLDSRNTLKVSLYFKYCNWVCVEMAPYFTPVGLPGVLVPVDFCTRTGHPLIRGGAGEPPEAGQERSKVNSMGN